jgi:hypothetical protein
MRRLTQTQSLAQEFTKFPTPVANPPSAKLADHSNLASKNILLTPPIIASLNLLLLSIPLNRNTSSTSTKLKFLPRHPTTPHASFERLLKLKNTQIILIEKMAINKVIIGSLLFIALNKKPKISLHSEFSILPFLLTHFDCFLPSFLP